MKKLLKNAKDRFGEKRIASIKKALKVCRVVKNVICWTLIALLTIAIIIFMVTKISGGTPSVFGYSVHRVLSGSMAPTLEIGDVFVGTEVKDVFDLQVGDIVTFKGDSRFDEQKVTHRILVAPYDDGKGNTVIVTKGDANVADDGEIDCSSIESKYLLKLGFLRDLYMFFFSPWGLIVFVVLLLLIFFDEILNIIRLTVSASEQDDSESLKEIVERIKREQLEKAKQSPDDSGDYVLDRDPADHIVDKETKTTSIDVEDVLSKKETVSPGVSEKEHTQDYQEDQTDNPVEE